jgi:hypothetical protein
MSRIARCGASIATVAIGIVLGYAPMHSMASSAVQELKDLVEVAPDGRELTSWFKKSRTVADVRLANAQAAAEVTKAASVESALTKLRSELVKSCKTITRSQASQIEVIVIKLSSFQRVLSEVQSELKRSLELMRREALAEKPGVTAFRLRHEVPVYEIALSQFGALQVNAQQIGKAVNAIATSIPRAAEGCGPTTIPPLFSQANAWNTKTRTKDAPGVAPILPRQAQDRPAPRLW